MPVATLLSTRILPCHLVILSMIIYKCKNISLQAYLQIEQKHIQQDFVLYILALLSV